MFTAIVREFVKLTFGPVGDASAGPKAEIGDLSGQVFIENGTGVNAAERGWHDVRTLAASTAEDLDLQTQVDNNNVALGLTEVVLLRIEADSGNGGNIEVKPGSSNGWTSYLKDASDIAQLIPGGVMRVECRRSTAYAVSGTNKVININNTDAGASGSYTITVIGRDS